MDRPTTLRFGDKFLHEGEGFGGYGNGVYVSPCGKVRVSIGLGWGAWVATALVGSVKLEASAFKAQVAADLLAEEVYRLHARLAALVMV